MLPQDEGEMKRPTSMKNASSSLHDAFMSRQYRQCRRADTATLMPSGDRR
jgi:hypothetical protein